MQIVYHPLFLLTLGSLGVICSGLLLKETFKIRKQLHIEMGHVKSVKRPKKQVHP